MNMFVPTNDIKSGVYESYQDARPSIAVENTNLIKGFLVNGYCVY